MIAFPGSALFKNAQVYYNSIVYSLYAWSRMAHGEIALGTRRGAIRWRRRYLGKKVRFIFVHQSRPEGVDTHCKMTTEHRLSL